VEGFAFAPLLLVPHPTGFHREESGSLMLRIGAVSVGDGCALIRFLCVITASVSPPACRYQGGNEVFCEVDVLAFERGAHDVRRVLREPQRVTFAAPGSWPGHGLIAIRSDLRCRATWA